MRTKAAKKPTKTRVRGKSSKLRSGFYVLITLAFAGVTFAILTVVPKSTVVELDVHAQRVSFFLPEAADTGALSLLYSSLWTDMLNIEKFDSISLHITSFENGKQPRRFENPLSISPISQNARLTLRSNNRDISVQELFCSPGSQVTFQKNGEELYFEIRSGQGPPYETLSLGHSVTISVRACRVTDARGRNLHELFSAPQRVGLHELSRSLSIIGQDKGLSNSIAKSAGDEESVQLLFRQSISSVDFSRTLISQANSIQQSTLDRLSVQRNFPLDSLEFTARNVGDLEIRPEPNQFIMYDLSATSTQLRTRLGAKLTSLKVSQGAITTELVPGFLSFMTKNPTTAIVITWLGWILTIFIPLFTKLFSRKP
ncbi:MAG TPA: hypothetical protein VGA99_09415 [bacterium]